MSAEAIVRALYARVAAGDFAGVMELLADDVVFVQAPALPFGGEWHGHKGFSDMAAQILAAWPGFRALPQDYFPSADDRQVTVLASLSGEGLVMDMVELWPIDGDRITRCQPFYFDTAAAARTAKDVRP